jgi:hypothetical protein
MRTTAGLHADDALGLQRAGFRENALIFFGEWSPEMRR